MSPSAKFVAYVQTAVLVAAPSTFEKGRLMRALATAMNLPEEAIREDTVAKAVEFVAHAFHLGPEPPWLQEVRENAGA